MQSQLGTKVIDSGNTCAPYRLEDIHEYEHQQPERATSWMWKDVRVEEVAVVTRDGESYLEECNAGTRGWEALSIRAVRVVLICSGNGRSMDNECGIISHSYSKALIFRIERRPHIDDDALAPTLFFLHGAFITPFAWPNFSLSTIHAVQDDY